MGKDVGKSVNRKIKTSKNMRYFIKFSVEYYRFLENNSNFAAVMTF